MRGPSTLVAVFVDNQDLHASVPSAILGAFERRESPNEIELPLTAAKLGWNGKHYETPHIDSIITSPSCAP